MYNWCLIMFINVQESQVFIRTRRYIKKKERREGKSRSRKGRRNRNRKRLGVT